MRAKDCKSCIYHHADRKAPEGWWCGFYRKWICNKSLEYKDYSRGKKEKP